MKSVRLDPETEHKLGLASSWEGVTESEFIREAVRQRAEVILGERLDVRLSDVIGVIDTSPPRTRRTQKAG